MTDGHTEGLTDIGGDVEVEEQFQGDGWPN